MEFDAFTGGVEPGGLRTKNQIRILICYLLSSVDAPLSRQDIIGIMQDNGLANYFEVTDALAELLGNGNITADEEHPDLLSATRQARMIAKQLDAAVPLSVRERAVSAAVNLLAAAKRIQCDLPRFRGRHGADELYTLCHGPLSGPHGKAQLPPRPGKRLSHDAGAGHQ